MTNRYSEAEMTKIARVEFKRGYKKRRLDTLKFIKAIKRKLYLEVSYQAVTFLDMIKSSYNEVFKEELKCSK